jgi:hypothetical protein
MFELPLGKAIIAVEVDKKQSVCDRCFFFDACAREEIKIACTSNDRKDSKNVIFKLVDYKEHK